MDNIIKLLKTYFPHFENDNKIYFLTDQQNKLATVTMLVYTKTHPQINSAYRKKVFKDKTGVYFTATNKYNKLTKVYIKDLSPALAASKPQPPKGENNEQTSQSPEGTI